MGFQVFNDLLYQQPSATTVASSASELSIMTSTLPLPANYWYVGRTVKLEAWGKASDTGTPTLRFRLRFGGLAGTVIIDWGALTLGSGISNLIWHISATLVCRAVGATGSLFGYGELTCGIGMFSTDRPQMGSSAGASAPAAATVDTTTGQDLTLTAQWSASSSSNTVTCDHCDVIALN